ncbi:hypothetical protein ATANTOWER_031910 [Ataeniobius toweri]|uniref:Ig-like domain-containing protein n=1 Tax=Ataeniobius toweri TaxID=208326 RepID=A0ABU7BAP0_9TELE|nr:hypothetical protein [Ataeniobius toweri]
MTLICVLIWTLLCCCFTESKGQVTVTQPAAVRADLGGSVTISCRTSQNVKLGAFHDQFWFQKRDGEPPKLIIKFSDQRGSGVPDRFSGIGSHSDFTLTIREVKAEDAAVYYCMGAFPSSASIFTQ